MWYDLAASDPKLFRSIKGKITSIRREICIITVRSCSNILQVKRPDTIDKLSYYFEFARGSFSTAWRYDCLNKAKYEKEYAHRALAYLVVIQLTLVSQALDSALWSGTLLKRTMQRPSSNAILPPLAARLHFRARAM